MALVLTIQAREQNLALLSRESGHQERSSNSVHERRLSAFPAKVSSALLAIGFVAASCATKHSGEVKRASIPYSLAQQPGEKDGNDTRGPMLLAGQIPGIRFAQTIGEEALGLEELLRRFAIKESAIYEETLADLARSKPEPPTAPLPVPMPPSSKTNWTELIIQLDRFLLQPISSTDSIEALNAKVALEEELALEQSRYIRIPDGLEASVTARAMAFGSRISDQVKQQIREQSRGVELTFSATNLQWPVSPVVITSQFGTRSDPFSGDAREHPGVDLKAEAGQLVRASSPGVVLRAGWAGGYGLRIELLHPDGLVTTYSHLSSALVSQGLHVPLQAPIGLAGSSGRSTGPHLHFEVLRNGEPFDPLTALATPAIFELASKHEPKNQVTTR